MNYAPVVTSRPYLGETIRSHERGRGAHKSAARRLSADRCK